MAEEKEREREIDRLEDESIIFIEHETKVWFLQPDLDFTKGDQLGVILKNKSTPKDHLQ